MTCAAARPRWRSTSKSPGSASLAVATDKLVLSMAMATLHSPYP